MDRRRSQQASPRMAPTAVNDDVAEEPAIDNDLDYLRSNEEAERRGHLRKSSSTHKKRTSLPSIAGAKNIFAGRFGDAFKRFEQTNDGEDTQDRPRTPEKLEYTQEAQMLSPILGSEATPTKYSEASSAIDETEDLPPDVRRELERRRLSQEEKRVAEAAAEYRARVTANGTGTSGTGAGPSRASTIQKRVQSLLDEGRQSPVPKKTAEGYGKYTEVSSPPLQQQREEGYALPPRGSSLPKPAAPAPARAPVPQRSAEPAQQPELVNVGRTRPHQLDPVPVQHSAPAQPQQQQRIVSRPSAPPKPKVLRTGQWPPPQSPSDTAQPIQSKPTGLAALLAKDLEGVPDYPPPQSSGAGSGGAGGNGGGGAYYASNDDDVEDFSKRYPSLGGLEMVEREIGDSRRTGSVREV